MGVSRGGGRGWPSLQAYLLKGTPLVLEAAGVIVSHFLPSLAPEAADLRPGGALASCPSDAEALALSQTL